MSREKSVSFICVFTLSPERRLLCASWSCWAVSHHWTWTTIVPSCSPAPETTWWRSLTCAPMLSDKRLGEFTCRKTRGFYTSSVVRSGSWNRSMGSPNNTGLALKADSNVKSVPFAGLDFWRDTAENTSQKTSSMRECETKRYTG